MILTVDIYTPTGLVITLTHASLTTDSSPWVTVRGDMVMPQRRPLYDYITGYHPVPWYLLPLHWTSPSPFWDDPAEPIYAPFPTNATIKDSFVHFNEVVKDAKFKVPSTWVMIIEKAH